MTFFLDPWRIAAFVVILGIISYLLFSNTSWWESLLLAINSRRKIWGVARTAGWGDYDKPELLGLTLPEAIHECDWWERHADTVAGRAVVVLRGKKYNWFELKHRFGLTLEDYYRWRYAHRNENWRGVLCIPDALRQELEQEHAVDT
jgi:hypothetical protein